jgi:hypothetical protein
MQYLPLKHGSGKAVFGVKLFAYDRSEVCLKFIKSSALEAPSHEDVWGSGSRALDHGTRCR